MQIFPLTVGGSYLHNLCSVSYDFGGPSIPSGYQSLSGTFSGALTSASLFHYLPWSTSMPSSSSMYIPSMVHILQTNVSPGSTQKPSLTSGMSVPIPLSVGPSRSLTIS
jgi:hypothetical protein